VNVETQQLRAELRDMKDQLASLQQEIAQVKSKLERIELQQRRSVSAASTPHATPHG
jgi:predicted  nucleic acid-binding Zn-ribbon protein